MDEQSDEHVIQRLKGDYNAPPETPREQIWAGIQAGLRSSRTTMPSLAEARDARRRTWRGPATWAAAAAAVLVLGIGIGRMSQPASQPGVPARTASDGGRAMEAVAGEYLGRTESLLVLVKADARGGSLDPVVGPWARSLLTDTRLLMDTPGGVDARMRPLLEDLELVLMQIVGATVETGENDARAGMELDLALRGLENREVLPRIQAVMPALPGFAGT